MRLFPNPPDPRCHQFEAVAGRVAEVDAAAAAGPVDRLLDGDAVASQVSLPAGERSFVNREAQMSRARGAVEGHIETAVRSRLRRHGRIEEQDHPLAAAEEDMATRLLAVERKAQNIDIEPLSRIEVGGVETRFEDVLDFFWKGGCHLVDRSI